MKKLIFSWLLSVLFLSTTYAQYGTARTGYEGDYFSLEGALDLFKQSYTLRDFERKLNTEENWVNNLDLNYDGRIDYIRVEHRQQGNYHAIILQALVDRYEVQDVAVIEIEIIGGREAILQIVGDEDLYGEEVIVEPVEGYSDSRRGYNSDYGDYVNVYYWKPVQYILGRQYRVYISPYRWQYYPVWWRPWVPCTWSIFRPRIVIYHKHYHVVHRHRVIRVHNFYRTYRSYSYNVVQRANKVRVEHGKSPVHRPRPAPVIQQGRNPSDYRRRNNAVERPGNTTRSRTPSQSPSVSRKRTLPPRVDQRSRSSANSPGRPRSTTPDYRPSEKSRKTTPSSASDQKANRSTTPQVKQPSRSTTTRPRATTRSTLPARKPTANSRTAPSARPKANRSASPRGDQQSRNKTTRSSTTTRSRTTTQSTTPARKPAASSRRSAPTSKSKANRSTTSKRSSSKSGSRSRGGAEF
jgi:hypothetical protein